MCSFAWHHLNHDSAGRHNEGFIAAQQHAEQNGRRDLFGFRQIVREVLGELSRHNGNRTNVRVAVKSDIETGLANDVEHSLSDYSADVELPVLANQQFGVGVLDVTSHFSVFRRLGGYSADRSVALDLDGQPIKVL